MTPEEAYIKCEYKINKKLELIIIKNPYYAYLYARDVIKGRWIEAEEIISTDSECAYYYSRAVIKGRWTEAEDIISTNSYYSFLYSVDVIKGKLPENMHNAMLVHALREKASEWWTGEDFAKLYFNFIKYNTQP